MTITGTQQRVYGILTKPCPCCTWEWRSQYWTEEYHTSAPCVDQVTLCRGKIVSEYNKITKEWENSVEFEEGEGLPDFYVFPSPNCYSGMTSLNCKKIETPFHGFFQELSPCTQYVIYSTMIYQNDIENVTSISFYSMLTVQNPGTAYGLVYITYNGTRVQLPEFDIYDGWVKLSKTFDEPVTISKIELTRLSTQSNNNYFLMLYSEFQINGKCYKL